MKALLVLGSFVAVLGATCEAKKPIEESSDVKFELDMTKNVLALLEASYIWETQPRIKSIDMCAVAELVARLDQQTLDQVDNSDRLLKTLFHAVRAYSDQSEQLRWSERCNDDCTIKIIEEYMRKRNTLLSSSDNYKNLDNSFANKLFGSLLDKPGAEPLSETLIHSAFSEYQSHIDSLLAIGKDNPLSSELSSIDTATYYKNRQEAYAMTIMLDAYKAHRRLKRFADAFKKLFYRTLQLYGFIIRKYHLIKIEKVVV